MAYTTVSKHTNYFNTKLYTGTGSSLALTGVGFQPDLVWIKPRNEVRGHNVQDSIRGTGGLFNIDTNAEYTGRTQEVTAFDSDGFTVGTSNDVNKLNNTHVAWNWKAGGTASSNTDGSITSTVSVNTTAGFSIVKWTGSGATATIGHGLGSVPKMIIVKNRYTTQNWIVYHSTLGNNKHLKLNLTDTEATTGGTWNNTDPTSSVFTVHTNANVNASGNSMMAYCFAEIPGYSHFGSYIGNGNADGSFVYTGFKPTWMLVKHASGGTASGEHWNLQDVKRSPYNTSIIMLSPNQTAADNSTTNNSIDILSNGFKIRTVDGRLNNAAATYIYMAFGQTLVGSNNIPCTAR